MSEISGASPPAPAEDGSTAAAPAEGDSSSTSTASAPASSAASTASAPTEGDSSAASTAAAPAEGDSSAVSTLRTTKPGTKRLILSLSVLLPFLFAVPVLLKSTEIYRSPLPFDSIDSLSARLQSNPLSLPCRFQAVFLGTDSRSLAADQLALSISEDMRRRTANTPACGGCGTNYTVSVTVDSGEDCVCIGDGCRWRCGTLVDPSGLGGSDEAVDDLLDAALRETGECLESFGGRVYTFVVVEREEEARVVVGKHRHAWMVGRVSEMDAVSMAGRIFVDFFMNGGKAEGEMEQGKGEFMPVGSDGNVILSFSLLNANPNDWVYDWEFQKIDNNMLAQVVEALAPIANISIESQVLYHTPKSSISYWDNELGSYIFSPRDLPFFVNSNEWHLDTSIAAVGRSKILQFVVYVPSATECPLLLHLPNGVISKTNGFISPMWGGVIVWNPPKCSKDQRTHFTRHTISHEDLHKIFQVFIGQLRLLFGFKSDYFHPAEVGISNFLSSERGFTEWELDALFRHHACYNLNSSVTTLVSLSKLVQSLPRMIVKDEIGKQVKLSLDAASLAQQNASIGIYDASAVSSRKARALAEDAFFHPSIMSISYASIEHYFAIYMPFFAPVSLHVLLSAIRELKRYRRERAKYLAFVADQAKVAA